MPRPHSPKTHKKPSRGPSLAFGQNAPQNTFAKLCKDSVEVMAGTNAGLGENVSANVSTVQVPVAFRGLYQPYRYKVFYGGRGGAKSWQFADALITRALERKTRILCARELQVSISDSVHRLLSDRIAERKLSDEFVITQNAISAKNGSEFLFKGLRHNVTEIKSLEGVDVAWIEEAQKVSRESWNVLLPTIRKEGSEIWISFNPGTPNDPTWEMFVLNPRPGSLVVKVTWRDNPWFPATLNAERLACQSLDPHDYAWIWEGEPRVITEAQILRGRWRVEDFAIPHEGVRWFSGADWGFAADPTVLVQAYIYRDKAQGKEEIRVCREAWQKGIELDNLPQLFDQLPGVRQWPIVADAARPEIIRHMRRQGFIVKPSPKWAGSIEDGIATLRRYGLVIHPSCLHTAEEARLYSYKVDPLTNDILPVILDKHNHCMDALRYAFAGVTRGKTGRAA